MVLFVCVRSLYLFLSLFLCFTNELDQARFSAPMASFPGASVAVQTIVSLVESKEGTVLREKIN